MYLSRVNHYDVIIIGAGLAGLTAAIHLGMEKHSILVFERQTFPHHKVCGEYVSNEVRPYLSYLGVDLSDLPPVKIDTLQFTSVKGRTLKVGLPLGGFGISRYAFDNRLSQRVISLGGDLLFQSVVSVAFENGIFKVKTSENKTYTSKFVLGSFGKRSNLDKYLDRRFINRKSEWLAVKQHYKYDTFPDNLVALHNFKGGYGGLSKTETGAVNFCYLASYKSFQTHKNIEDFNRQVVAKNKYLETFLSRAEPILKEPLSIAQISFQPKELVIDHIIMCGDAAGLIHPLCGNGMAMAIHSAKIASELIHKSLKEGNKNRLELEKSYKLKWNHTFNKRIWWGRQLQYVLLNDIFSDFGTSVLAKSPWMLQHLIKSTHGKPLE